LVIISTAKNARKLNDIVQQMIEQQQTVLHLEDLRIPLFISFPESAELFMLMMVFEARFVAHLDFSFATS